MRTFDERCRPFRSPQRIQNLSSRMAHNPDPVTQDVAWLVAQLKRLTSRDWLEIIGRIGQPVEDASDAARWMVTGQDLSISPSDREQRVRYLLDTHDRIGAALRDIPERVIHNEQDISLRVAATTAATHLANGLLAGADLPARLFALLALPFRGYIDFDERPSVIKSDPS
jgi:hypothetical protein